MSKAKKISLSAMLERLQAMMRYKHPEVAFNALLYGWRVANRHTSAWLMNKRKGDLLSYELAKDFAVYCLDADWQKMMPK